MQQLSHKDLANPSLEITYPAGFNTWFIANGWRYFRDNGGCVVNVKTNQTVATNLLMPHSPQWYRGRLWLLSLGTGEFGYINQERETFAPMVVCPDYLRGGTFYDNYMVL